MYKIELNITIKNLQKWDVNWDDIKEKFSFWRLGKIRNISFNPNGDILKIKIGTKYYKSLYLSDFNEKFRIKKTKT